MSTQLLNETRCALCKKGVLKDNVFCINCGYPQHGTPLQKQDFKKEREQKKASLREAKSNIVWVTSILGVMAFIFLAIAMLLGFKDDLNLGLLIPGVIIGFIYGGLSYWSTIKPFPAILCGLILYVTMLLISGLALPSSISGAIMWKGIILVAFIKGILSAKKAALLDKELAK